MAEPARTSTIANSGQGGNGRLRPRFARWYSTSGPDWNGSSGSSTCYRYQRLIPSRPAAQPPSRRPTARLPTRPPNRPHARMPHRPSARKHTPSWTAHPPKSRSRPRLGLPPANRPRCLAAHCPCASAVATARTAARDFLITATSPVCLSSLRTRLSNLTDREPRAGGRALAPPHRASACLIMSMQHSPSIATLRLTSECE